MTPEFNEWWNSEDIAAENPYDIEKPIYWAWEGWQAARKREWQGLTDEELNDLARWADEHGGAFHVAYGKAIEAKLKEKNDANHV